MKKQLILIIGLLTLSLQTFASSKAAREQRIINKIEKKLNKTFKVMEADLEKLSDAELESKYKEKIKKARAYDLELTEQLGINDYTTTRDAVELLSSDRAKSMLINKLRTEVSFDKNTKTQKGFFSGIKKAVEFIIDGIGSIIYVPVLLIYMALGGVWC